MGADHGANAVTADADCGALADDQGAQDVTPLCDILRERIAADGPITVADYMADCLMHPEHGYYTHQEVFGRQGDFVTAPEISQMFGEMIGLALGSAWKAQGSSKNAIVVELGPGKGTLMRDLRRIAPAISGFDQLPVHMLESAPKLRDIQAEAIPGVIHHRDISTLPQVPLFLIANEFFDALPIRQFCRTTAAWEEILIGARGGALNFGRAAPQLFDFLTHRLDDTQPGDIVECCPALTPIIVEISERISVHGGAALIVDYGDWRSQGDTLQAIGDHKMVNPLTAPGMTDLTAHTDFEAIFNSAAPAIASRLTTQGVFLERLGITQRAQALAQKLTGTALDTHIAAHRRLTHPDEMGNLFKVMGLAATTQELPPGLEV
ncbi:SAM-dependent methyltransferase [uncultured Planktomarina sp.]|uniref:class I SAM-dependent methyltransferase n=1 Tax=uncultured Planktomarina sp. TaxID=1538529 RepID=UPI0032609B51